MDSSLRRFLSGVINFFVLLNTRSHSADIAGIANVSKAQRCSVGKVDWALSYYLIGLKVFRSSIGVGSQSYLVNLSVSVFISKPIRFRRKILLEFFLGICLGLSGKNLVIYTS